MKVLIVIVTFCILLVQCNILYVSVGGSDTSSCGSTTFPCASPLQAATNAQSGDTISISPGVYLTATINISTKDLIFTAETLGTVEMKTSTAACFQIGAGRNVTFIGLSFSNYAVTAGSNAAFINSGTANFFDCYFNNNAYTTSADSGQLMLSYGTLNLERCYMVGNYALHTYLRSYYGFFLKSTGTTFINNCLIANNTIQNTNPWDISTMFGAMVSLGNYGSTTIQNTNIWGNQILISSGVRVAGGFILSMGAPTIITNVSFRDNYFFSTFCNVPGTITQGTLLSISQREITGYLQNVEFVNNTLDHGGGEIAGGMLWLPASSYMDSVSFINNSVLYTSSGNVILGGLAFLVANSMANCYFYNNHVIPSTRQVIGLNPSLLYSCSTNPIQGAIFLLETNCDAISNITVIDNSATIVSSDVCFTGQALGMAYIYSFIPLSLENSHFERNTINGGVGASGSMVGGGALYLLGQPTVISNCTFASNSVRAGDAIFPTLAGSGSAGSAFGGALYLNVSTTISNSTFTNNWAFGGNSVDSCSDNEPAFPVVVKPGAASGGAIYQGFGSLLVTDCPFSGNTATSGIHECHENIFQTFSSGGAIHSEYLHIDACNFTSNSCGLRCKGGAIFTANATIDDSIFDTNVIMDGFGAALFIEGADLQSILTSSNTTFRNNVGNAGASGGAIYISNITNAVFAGVSISNNVASYGSGIFYYSFPSYLTFTELDIINNTASVSGGATFVDNYDKFVTTNQYPFVNGQLIQLSNSSTINGSLLATVQVGNTAMYGANYGSSILRLGFKNSPPTYVWPGQRFSAVLMLLDIFGNVVITDKYQLLSSDSQNSTKYITGVPQDTIQIDMETGLFTFPSAMILSEPGDTLDIHYTAFLVAESSDATNFVFSAQTAVSTTSCAPGFSYVSGQCNACPADAFNFNGTTNACQPCPSEGESKECMVYISNVARNASLCEEPTAPGLKTEESCNPCEEYGLTDAQCQLVLEGSSSVFKISQGFWPVPSANDFVNPTGLIECENCQAFYCSIAWSADPISPGWNVNCNHTTPDTTPEGEAAGEEEEGDAEEDAEEECEYNEIEPCCCLGYAGRKCSKCAEGYYQEREVCFECSDEWYDSFNMIFLDLLLIAVLVVIAILVRNNLIALCIELFVVIALYLIGIGTIWYLFLMILILLVLFVTSSNIREGILKSLIFYVQTCSLLLSGLFTWGSIDLDIAIKFLQRNGLECYINYSAVTRFWVIMSLPVIIALVCLFMLFLGKLRLAKRSKKDVQHLEGEHFIDPSTKLTLQCIKICLFLWYILYYEIAASVSVFFPHCGKAFHSFPLFYFPDP